MIFSMFQGITAALHLTKSVFAARALFQIISFVPEMKSQRNSALNSAISNILSFLALFSAGLEKIKNSTVQCYFRAAEQVWYTRISTVQNQKIQRWSVVNSGVSEKVS